MSRETTQFSAGSGPLGLRVGRTVLSAALALLAIAFLTTLTTSAGAANTRVSITDYQWSDQPTVDLGETVTWDWLGPDLQHSVTGRAPNATQWDSDPSISMPLHPLGSTYSVTFDQPGEYLFVCKVHSSVRGVITVTGTPGDPNSDPGPQPPVNFDLEPPQVDEIRLFRPRMGHRGKGTKLEFASSEGGRATVDYYRLRKRGKGKNQRTVRAFAGYSAWDTHIGYNYDLRFANRSENFPAKPGSYVGMLEVTDEAANTAEPIALNFEIKQDPKVLKQRQVAKRKAARQKAKRKAAKRKAARKKAARKKAAKKKAAKRRAAAGKR